MQHQHQLRVLADGWGQQTTGSVFCADSSLRYIYEGTNYCAPRPQSTKVQSRVYNASHSVPSYCKTGNHKTTFGGKRPRENSIEKGRESQGVDLFEAEIARACATISKQASALPPSCLECSVCLSSNALAQILVCGHTFHSHCFLRWFRLNRSCPLCRGPVDKVQLAQPMPLQDELDAIMAEIDDDPLQLVCARRSEVTLKDPLVANSDQFMAFLDADFETDMQLVAFEDLTNDVGATAGAFGLALKQEAHEKDETMDTGVNDLIDNGDKEERSMATTTSSCAPLSPIAPQYPPASAIPNYWNVLNQGNAPSIVPPAPAVPPQRMVHIAPKPDATVMTQQPQTVKKTVLVHQASQQSHHHRHHGASTLASAPRVVSCRCTGGCRNGRCACVKGGGMCGISCRCTSCKNPFLMVKAAGTDIDALLKDDCFMHNVPKTRDMVQRLQEPVAVPCCKGTIKIVDCVQGYTCAPCKRRYDFSWCTNKLLDSKRTPRNHCTICKRCCDHRDVHCNDCGRCYFAGVAAGLPCPCQESSSHKKRPETAAKDKAEEEGEGECCIM